MEQERLIQPYSTQAYKYVWLNKRNNGLGYRWRRQLWFAAQDCILEVLVRAGAGFKFYPVGVQVTAIDISSAMIAKTKEAAVQLCTNTQFTVSIVA